MSQHRHGKPTKSAKVAPSPIVEPVASATAKPELRAGTSIPAIVAETVIPSLPPIEVSPMDNQNTTTDTAAYTNTAADMGADMQARTQAAFGKGSELTADMSEFHKGNVEAMVEAGKVLAAGMQDLSRNAIEEAKAAAETATADIKAMAAIKSPTELFQLQGEIMRRNLDTVVTRTSQNVEAMMKLTNDMFAPLSSRASVAMERMNKAA